MIMRMTSRCYHPIMVIKAKLAEPGNQAIFNDEFRLSISKQIFSMLKGIKALLKNQP